MDKVNKGLTRQEADPLPKRETPAARRRREQQRQRLAQERSHKFRLLLGIAVATLAAAVVLAGGYYLATQSGAAPNTGAYVEGQGRDHVLRGESHPPYNTTPPTSGWHYDNAVAWGIYDQPIEDEAQVHNLEHGGIMIQYWCPESCPDLVDQLKGVVGRYRSKVILAPYSRPLPDRIALTAWQWIDTFEDFDEQRIVSFIEAHVNQGPEQVPD